MLTCDDNDLEKRIMSEIARVLGYTDSELPFSLKPNQVSKVLNKSPGTLAVWRSTGRYNLDYFKSGSDVEYLTFMVAKFIVKYMRAHTSQKEVSSHVS